MTQDPWKLMKENISDPVIFKQIESSFIKRARITAVVLGSFLIIAFLAVVYAFIQVTKARENEKIIIVLQQQIEAEKVEAEKQAALAIESKMIAEEAAKVAYEELEACRKKK